MRVFLLLVLASFAVQAQEPVRLRLTLVHFAGGSWQEGEIVTAASEALQILAQCGLAPGGVQLKRLDVDARFRIFHTPTSRELARTLQIRKPAIFFVDGTRQDPAFEAEAIGRGNSRSRPELRDTVWVVRGARDPGVVLAHELAHVVMDSGEHSAEPGNLMRENTAPENTKLNDAQCALLKANGTAHNLLR
jgi:hypothetical protein